MSIKCSYPDQCNLQLAISNFTADEHELLVRVTCLGTNKSYKKLLFMVFTLYLGEKYTSIA